jgi:hypothetical protein
MHLEVNSRSSYSGLDYGFMTWVTQLVVSPLKIEQKAGTAAPCP